MRIVHTSDWHAGRIWKSRDRLPELQDVLDRLGDFIERERIDLLLMSGDVFDGRAPAAEAERCVFRFFKRVGRAGTKTVVIAGNHDHPARLEAWGTLAELVDVRVVGSPRSADNGGALEIETRSGERAIVGAIPFAPASALVSALEMAADETVARQVYADGMRHMVDNLCGRFRADTVNLLMAHTHLDGALWSGSERTVHLGTDWAATRQALPSNAHYVALGHIHKPQVVEAPSPAQYAGSPLQLDFGEAGEVKSFVVIDARPRQPARAERVPYVGGVVLAKVRATLAELDSQREQLLSAGLLHVTVPLDAPDADLNSKVRRLLPNAVTVQSEVAVLESPKDLADHRGLAPIDLFRAYSVSARGKEPDAAVALAFEELHDASEEQE